MPLIRTWALGCCLATAVLSTDCARGDASAEAPGAVSGVRYLSSYKDVSQTLTAEDASRAPFEPLRGAILEEGFSNAVHWLRLVVPHGEGKEPLFLVFESLTLDEAEIYSAQNPQAALHRTGDRFPRSSWAVPWTDYPTFPVGSGKTYLIRLRSTSLLLMPVTLRSESDLRELTERRTYMSALYAGFIFMLCLAAVGIFLALRDYVYLLYVGYIASQTLAFGALFSSFYRLVWPESPYIQNHLYFFAQAMSLAFGTAFFRVFMDLAERRPRLNIFVTSVTVVSIIIAAGTLVSAHNVIFSRALSLIYMLWIPVFLFMTMRQIEPGRIDMWIFVLVWGAVYVAGILFMLVSARIIAFHSLLFYGPTALFPFDAIFFIISLYKRYRNMEAARTVLEREMRSTLARLASQSHEASGAKKGGYPKTKLAGVNVAGLLEQLDHALRVEKLFKREDLSLADLARHVGITPHQLSEICNNQLKTSFPKLLSYHRVLEAQALMSNSELNILQIAFESGFASKSSFNIEFKRVTGMTPREYRARPDVHRIPEDSARRAG